MVSVMISVIVFDNAMLMHSKDAPIDANSSKDNIIEKRSLWIVFANLIEFPAAIPGPTLS
jgi:hypothetical protein